MIESIKTAFLDLLENVDWMDTDTRSEAKQKVISILLNPWQAISDCSFCLLLLETPVNKTA